MMFSLEVVSELGNKGAEMFLVCYSRWERNRVIEGRFGLCHDLKETDPSRILTSRYHATCMYALE